MKNHMLPIAFGLLILLAACGKAPSDKTDTPAQAPQAKAPTAAVAAQVAPPDPQADPATPDSQYAETESGNQLMFLYYALSDMPVDYEAIAKAYSSDYRSTSDAFRKQDIMNSLKPRIDAEIARAKTARYFIYEIRPELQHYDFAGKAFAIKNLQAGYSWYVSDNSQYQLTFPNADAYSKLRVDDETLARSIEGMVGKYPSPALRIYGFAQGVDLNKKWVKAQIVKIELRDARGSRLAVN